MAETYPCDDCCKPAVEEAEPVAFWAMHMGHLYVFCSRKCLQHWMDDSQQGADLKEMLA